MKTFVPDWKRHLLEPDRQLALRVRKLCRAIGHPPDSPIKVEWCEALQRPRWPNAARWRRHLRRLACRRLRLWHQMHGGLNQ